MDYLQQSVQNRIIVLFIAAAVDLLIGDPHWLWHPVQGVGTLISFFEKILRRIFAVPPRPERAGKPQEENVQKGKAKKGKEEKRTELSSPAESGFRTRERIAGVLMVLLVLAVSTGLICFLLIVCGRIHLYLRLLFEGALCGRLLALRSLGEAGCSVRDPLLKGDIEGARRAVAMIVGRDTERLDEEGIAKAAVETVAENTSDGVTAPLFYMILFGGIGGIFYKAVNTMDSMTGYKNARYRYFGTAAARLDDVMNFIPARLTALLMILACCLPGKASVTAAGKTARIPDAAAAFKIWRRDRRKSPSPNSAQTESVCAGALHLRLLGDTWYFGELHHKAEIGDGGRRTEPEDITRSVRLMNRTTFLMFAAGIILLALVRLMH
jgi:adenosylcobinamide-phosphate synthase